MIEKCSLTMIMTVLVALQASPEGLISLDFPISGDTHRWLCKSSVCVCNAIDKRPSPIIVCLESCQTNYPATMPADIQIFSVTTERRQCWVRFVACELVACHQSFIEIACFIIEHCASIEWRWHSEKLMTKPMGGWPACLYQRENIHVTAGRTMENLKRLFFFLHWWPIALKWRPISRNRNWLPWIWLNLVLPGVHTS